MLKVKILDSTLRDGAQGEGVSFSVYDKLNIVKALDEFGVSYIEAGNPGSNPKDMEFFEKIADIKLKNAKICAFGSTHRKDKTPEEDANFASLLSANTDVVCIFGKSWDLHVTEILKTTLENNKKIVYQSMKFFKDRGKEVIFDAEHFFDGYKNNPDYAMEALESAVKGGADVLSLCDTNGGTYPLDIYKIVKKVKEKFPDVSVGIHCHEDTGCATASTLMAVEAGADHVQGTFIGIGERCGNADLSVIIPNLEIKRGIKCVSGDISQLTQITARISEISNIGIRRNKPFVGKSAFAHKAGMHVDAVLKLPKSFEHIEPESVGNKRRILMSEVAGKTTVLAKIAHIAPELKKDSPEVAKIVATLKELEHKGYQFEAADASFELMVKKIVGTYVSHFETVLYKTTGEFPTPDEKTRTSAMIQIKVGDKDEITAALGNGPVNALDGALRKALSVFYPELSSMHLIDYKVRVLEAKEATGAQVRVLIESTDGENIWTTVGVSADIIEASFMALVDSIEYKLSKN